MSVAARRLAQQWLSNRQCHRFEHRALQFEHEE
jgi:hypothetical protein